MSVITTLRKAQTLLGKEGRWVQGEFGVDKNGGSISPAAPQARMFCSLGAVQHVLGLNSDGYFDTEYADKEPSPAEMERRREEYLQIKKLLAKAAQARGPHKYNGNTGAYEPLTPDAQEILDAGCHCGTDNGWWCEHCQLVEEVTNFDDIVGLNDAAGTTVEDVLNAFAAAIKYAKAGK